jgi:hypothetical protein
MPFQIPNVQVAISFLSELGEQEIIDAEAAAKLDLARGVLRPQVGKWRFFFSLEPPDFTRVLGIDNRVKFTDRQLRPSNRHRFP